VRKLHRPPAQSDFGLLAHFGYNGSTYLAVAALEILPRVLCYSASDSIRFRPRSFGKLGAGSCSQGYCSRPFRKHVGLPAARPGGQFRFPTAPGYVILVMLRHVTGSTFISLTFSR